MKKFMSIMLTMGLMASSMSLGFAATDVAKEIEDKDVKEAVERLAAFGIVNGMEDGKYHEELKVTREQFAKILVTALGLESAAIQGPTQFADVEAGRWSSGYVNVAVGQGILKGYPDGTFQPTKEVSYGEAVTMLVRALGYQDEFLPGQWPANYIAKAADEDITNGVKFVAGGTSNRGDVAIMVDNTLDAKIIEVEKYGGVDITTYTKGSKTLLQDKLKIEKKEDVRLIANKRIDSNLDKDELTLEFLKEKNDTKDFDFVDGFSTEKFLGLEITAYVNDDDEVIFAEKETADSSILVDIVDEYKNGEFTFFFNDSKDYEVASEEKKQTARTYINNKKETMYENAGDFVGKFGRFVIDNGEIVFADALDFEINGGVVDKVDDKVIVYAKGSDDEKKFNLKDYDSYVVVDKERNEMALEDIKSDDVIYVAETKVDGDDVAYIVVVSNKKEDVKIGDVTSGTPLKLEVDGKDIKLGANVTASADQDKNLKDSPDAGYLDDFYGAKATVIFDIKDRIRHVRGDVKSTSDVQYGVVKKADTGINSEIKIYTKDDKDVVFKFEDDDKIFNAKSDIKVLKDITKGDVVAYELTKDGEIAEETLRVYDLNKPANIETIGDDFGKESVNVGGTVYYFDSESVVFDLGTPNLADGSGMDEAVVDYKSLAEKDADGKGIKVVAIKGDDKDIDALVFVAKYDEISSDDSEAAYVIRYKNRDGDNYAEIKRFGKNDVETIQLKTDSDKNLGYERVVEVKEKSGDKIDLISVEDTTGENSEEKLAGDYKLVAGYVYDIDGRMFAIGGAESSYKYNVDSDAVVYEGDEKSSYSSVDEGDAVVALVKKKDGTIYAMETVDAKKASTADSTDTWANVKAMGTGDIEFAVDITNKVTVAGSQVVVPNYISVKEEANEIQDTDVVRYFKNSDGDVVAVILVEDK